MSLTATMTAAPVVPAVGEARVRLEGIRWGTYLALLDDLADQSTIRMAYDQGTLEIMSPLANHERYNRTLNLLVEVVAEEVGLDVDNLGSTTFKAEGLARGFEPDSCFYIQHAAQSRDKSRLDFAVDPPPDLVIEIDITSGSLDKFPLYAALGVPEIWRYNGQRLTISTLSASGYTTATTSTVLPYLTDAILTDFVTQSLTLPRTAFLRALRAWIRVQRG